MIVKLISIINNLLLIPTKNIRTNLKLVARALSKQSSNVTDPLPTGDSLIEAAQLDGEDS